jgi:hypothetical protein
VWEQLSKIVVPLIRVPEGKAMSTSDDVIHTVSEQDLQSFQAEFKGDLILPGAPHYDQARAVWNGMIDRHPALIARCLSTEDVVAGVKLARRLGLPLAVRGGGHNVAGHAASEGGIVLDLSLLKQIEVDPERRRARVGGRCVVGRVGRSYAAPRSGDARWCFLTHWYCRIDTGWWLWLDPKQVWLELRQLNGCGGCHGRR